MKSAMAYPASATLHKPTILATLLLLNPLTTFKFRPNLNLKIHTTKASSLTLNCSNSTTSSWSSETDQESSEDEEEGNSNEEVKMGGQSLPMRTTRRRYRKMYPGEKEGITEEMRFVAMKLRNSGKPKKPKVKNKSVENDEEMIKSDEEIDGLDSLGEENDENGQSWEPSVEGFLKYLVDSKHVFSTIERIVDESSDVSCKCYLVNM
ncbi:hypothetical protein LIER_43557 [Lithospermum erythrorhizon]|uniref:Uncharacterized protein n=1 Tax=Lithospermum erythrorhizon TaxID=34254 RepID=A0AAV3QET0_LITER